MDKSGELKMKMEINITREDGFVSSNSAKAPRAVFFLLVCLINGEGSALGGKLGSRQR